MIILNKYSRYGAIYQAILKTIELIKKK
jgi:hypothetical protein